MFSLLSLFNEELPPLVHCLFDINHHFLFVEIFLLVSEVHSDLDVIEPIGHSLPFNLAKAYVVFKSIKALRLNDLNLKADEEVSRCFAPELTQRLEISLLSKYWQLGFNTQDVVFLKSKHFRNKFQEFLVLIIENLIDHWDLEDKLQNDFKEHVWNHKLFE